MQKISHLEIAWVAGTAPQLSRLCESGTLHSCCQEPFWLAHHCTASRSPDCKLQLHRIPGQFAVVQHIYIASINSPRLKTTGFHSPIKDLWAAGGFQSHFIYLRPQHCLWLCGSSVPGVVTRTANTTFWWETWSTSPRQVVPINLFCQLTWRNVLLNLITMSFLWLLSFHDGATRDLLVLE